MEQFVAEKGPASASTSAAVPAQPWQSAGDEGPGSVPCSTLGATAAEVLAGPGAQRLPAAVEASNCRRVDAETAPDDDLEQDGDAAARSELSVAKIRLRA